jgi:hypothetical protein
MASVLNQFRSSQLMELTTFTMCLQRSPLTEEQIASNTVKSKIRARVERVLGRMKTFVGELLIRSIGFARARLAIALMNLIYTIKRIEWLIRNQAKLNRTGRIGRLTRYERAGALPLKIHA